jgi:N-acetylglucosamine-6-phosphate deacetylase
MHDALLTINGNRLTACTPYQPSPGPEPEQITGWAVPGFIDTHVHGGGGFDYATGDPQEATSARAFHAAHGTTTSLASLVTAPVDVLCRQLTTLADLVEDGHLAGIHLEGPFLSPAQPGAHDTALLRLPDPATVEQLVTAGRDALTVVTVAPELPGADAAIGQLLDAGVRVAIGHTDADQHAAAAALDAGATVVTHLFNAMRGIHHREPGPIPRLLSDERVSVELIADGFHVHPDVLRLALAAAGPERVILVTDAMAAAGMPDGKFRLGGRAVRVRQGQARLTNDDGSPGPIAGSTLTMAGAFRVMTAITGDIPTVAALASTNAARRFGLADVGRIEPGRRADLCIVDDQGVLQRVLRAGAWLPPPDSR